MLMCIMMSYVLRRCCVVKYYSHLLFKLVDEACSALWCVCVIGKIWHKKLGWCKCIVVSFVPCSIACGGFPTYMCSLVTVFY